MATKQNEQSVATEAQNDKLKHPQSGATTRDDALDAGVPMLQGSEGERQGPEDAFGEGPKRGDYTGRVVAGESYISVPVENAKPGEPTAVLVPQAPRAAEIGDAKGLKGGVETDPAAGRAAGGPIR